MLRFTLQNYNVLCRKPCGFQVHVLRTVLAAVHQGNIQNYIFIIRHCKCFSKNSTAEDIQIWQILNIS